MRADAASAVTRVTQLKFPPVRPHNWSLCVEEQFYLLLPAVVLVVASLPRSRIVAWCAIGTGVAAGIAIRSAMWFKLGSDGGDVMDLNAYYTRIYYSSFCRFHELLAGVAVALLANFHRDLWQRIVAHGRLAGSAGAILTAVTLWLLLQDRYSHAMTVFGFPLLALSFGLLIVAALSPATILSRLRIPGAERLALWSYAVYLMHKQIGQLLVPPLESLGLAAGSAAGASVILVVSVASGWLLYRLVEMPFMRLRERHFQAPRTAVSASGAEALGAQRELHV